LRTFPLRVGVLILPELPWSRAGRLWRHAEELGFAHAWTYDHLTWRGHRDDVWYGAIPTLTAAAMVTCRIRLGPLVASANFRHPLPFAKELITLDDIAGGRITVGLGAGGTGWDATMLGHRPWSPEERAERFREFVELTDLLLREPATTFKGRHYSVSEARTYPGCIQRPRVPFAIAASGPRGMVLAAQHGQVWVTTGIRTKPGPIAATAGAKDVRDQIGRLEQALAAVGRDPATIDRLVLTGPTLESGLSSPEAFAETIGRYAEAGATDLVVHWPRARDSSPAGSDILERIL
jgi:alkanesulfonate monooxygenase SsuD/methylene tetrahydromethanopterin reductase-like flavin-dependent oxidoreductase (luciferase family)